MSPAEKPPSRGIFGVCGILFVAIILVALGFQFLDEEIASQVYSPMRVGLSHLTSVAIRARQSNPLSFLLQNKTGTQEEVVNANLTAPPDVLLEGDGESDTTEEPMPNEQVETVSPREGNVAVVEEHDELPSLFNVLPTALSVSDDEVHSLFALSLLPQEHLVKNTEESTYTQENERNGADSGLQQVVRKPTRRFLNFGG